MKHFLCLLLIYLSFGCTNSGSFNTRAEMEDAIIKAYLDSKNIDAIKTEEGVYYHLLDSTSNVRTRVEDGDSIHVNYTGWILYGHTFDSSYPRGEVFPVKIGTSSVIRAWQIVLPLMSLSDCVQVYIPSELGYGSQGSPPSIPGNSILVFDIKLEEIID